MSASPAAALSPSDAAQIEAWVRRHRFFAERWCWAAGTLRVEVAAAGCAACAEERSGHAFALARDIESVIGRQLRVVVEDPGALSGDPP